MWPAPIPNIYAGTSASLLYHFFFQNMGTMVFLITMALMLVILIITTCYSRMRPIMQVHYYYLFLFIVFASVWILTDSQLLPLTGASASFVSLLSFEMFMLMIVPFILFSQGGLSGFSEGGLLAMRLASRQLCRLKCAAFYRRSPVSQYAVVHPSVHRRCDCRDFVPCHLRIPPRALRLRRMMLAGVPGADLLFYLPAHLVLSGVKDYCAIIGLNQKDLENQGILA